MQVKYTEPMMEQLEPRSHEPTGLASLRLIVTVLTVGTCVAGGAVIFSASRIGGKIIAQPIIPYFIAAIGLIALVVQKFVIPNVARKSIKNPASQRERLSAFGTMILVRASMLEGAALLHFVFYLFTQSTVLLVTGTLVVIALALLRPSEREFQAWCASLVGDR